jgi:hypothetical protein
VPIQVMGYLLSRRALCPWRFAHRVLSASLLAALAGFAFVPHTIGINNLGPARKVIIYDGTNVASERAIAPDSPETKEFSEWLRKHRSGWTSSIVSFAPGGTTIEGDDYSVNFRGDYCIIGYKTWLGYDSQCTRALDPNDEPSIISRRP